MKNQTVVVTKKGLVPVPEGWDLESVLRTLEKAGHEVTKVRRESGGINQTPKKG